MRTAAMARNCVLGLVLGAAGAFAAAHADECVRSTPSPLFPAGRHEVQAHGFRLQSDHEAVERFQLGPDLRVTVAHGGCECFVTRFRFEAPGLFLKKYSPALAYAAAASLLRQLNGLRPDSPSALDLAAASLLQAARRTRVPELGQELPGQGDGSAPLATVVVVDAAGRGKSFGYIDISLFIGPL